PSRSPALATLFPYTTLFRSAVRETSAKARNGAASQRLERVAGATGGAATTSATPLSNRTDRSPSRRYALTDESINPGRQHGDSRSEEHTSELQSREKVVCRL